MDFWGAFIFFLLIFLIMSCCGYCCTSKRRGAILSTPVVVTSATHTAPGGYPVTQIQSVPGYQTNVYATPYPTQATTVTTQMPMPMQMQGAQPPPAGMPAQMPPYPPSGSMMNPPSYEAAVGVGGTTNMMPAAMPYEKQSPYNPSYTAQ